MSYFNETDAWIEELLNIILPSEEDVEEMKKQMKAKLLESYRNGQVAGQAPREGERQESKPAERKAWRPKRAA